MLPKSLTHAGIRRRCHSHATAAPAGQPHTDARRVTGRVNFPSPSARHLVTRYRHAGQSGWRPAPSAPGLNGPAAGLGAQISGPRPVRQPNQGSPAPSCPWTGGPVPRENPPKAVICRRSSVALAPVGPLDGCSKQPSSATAAVLSRRTVTPSAASRDGRPLATPPGSRPQCRSLLSTPSRRVARRLTPRAPLCQTLLSSFPPAAVRASVPIPVRSPSRVDPTRSVR